MVKIHGEGWRGRSRVATLHDVKLMIARGRHLDQVADAVIEAGLSFPISAGISNMAEHIDFL